MGMRVKKVLLHTGFVLRAPRGLGVVGLYGFRVNPQALNPTP